MISILVIGLMFLSNTTDNDTHQKFLENIQSLCGNSFAGEVIFPEEPPRGFTDPLTVHFLDCEGSSANVPFHVGENKTRTWMFTLTEEGLLFKHDHRNPDGTPDGLTNYGGWAAEDGTAFQQRFPADEETIGFRDGLRSHIWVVEFSEDMTTYSYSLYLYENLYFRADFDLTQPLDSL